MGFGDLEFVGIWAGKHDSDISERCGVGSQEPLSLGSIALVIGLDI